MSATYQGPYLPPLLKHQLSYLQGLQSLVLRSYYLTGFLGVPDFCEGRPGEPRTIFLRHGGEIIYNGLLRKWSPSKQMDSSCHMSGILRGSGIARSDLRILGMWVSVKRPSEILKARKRKMLIQTLADHLLKYRSRKEGSRMRRTTWKDRLEGFMSRIKGGCWIFP